MIEDVLQDVWVERRRQDSKWGIQNRPAIEWLAILSEEFGEVAKEVNELHFRDRDPTNYRYELVQTAAVCIAAIESLDRGFK